MFNSKIASLEARIARLESRLTKKTAGTLVELYPLFDSLSGYFENTPSEDNYSFRLEKKQINGFYFNDDGKLVARCVIAPKDTPDGTSIIVSVTSKNRKYSEKILVEDLGYPDYSDAYEALAKKVIKAFYSGTH